MFKKRVISGAVLVIMIILMNYIGSFVMGIALLLIAEQGLFEFYRTVRVYGGKSEGHNILEIIGYIGTAVYFTAEMFIENNGLLKLYLILCIVFVAMLAAYVFTFPRFESQVTVRAFFGFMYIPVMLGFIYMTRMMEYGIYLVWMIYIASWICDTCAYLVGMKFGKHKLAPVLSPKKSIEGAIGGIVGAALFSLLFSYVFTRAYGTEHNAFIFLFIGLVASVASQVGDLAASAFKRNYDVKDYGTMIPGHGGIMDRFDSVIFTAPMIYFLAALCLKL